MSAMIEMTERRRGAKARVQQPLLENGDCLSDEEFWERYERMPDLKKAELIDGVVYIMASPVSTDFHAEPQSDLVLLLGLFRVATPGVRGSDNGTTRLGKKNIPQPDVALFIAESSGGQSRMVDGYIVGPPELVAEISASTRSFDTNQKYRMYEQAGVKEYIVWRTEDDEIDCWHLVNGKYETLPADEAGVVRSGVFPGLWLDLPKLIEGDMRGAMATLQSGLATPEHAEFAARLAKLKFEGESK